MTQQHNRNANHRQPPHRKRRHSARYRRRRRKRVIACIILLVLFLLLLFILGSLVKFFFSAFTEKGNPSQEAASLTLEEQQVPDEATTVQEADATLLAVGDVIVHKPFLTSPHYLKADGTYDFNSIFTYIKDYYQAADFATITPEGSFVASNYSGYPMFQTPDAVATAFAANGIDMCLLANNHIYDNYGDGLQRTMDVVTQNSLAYTGIRRTAADKRYHVQDINGIKFGFFNYVYETEPSGGLKSINGIPVAAESAELINSYYGGNLEAFYQEVDTILQEMKTDGVEFIVAYMHWGIEYQTTESSEQNAIAQRLCDMGIDALIGSHPHVIQPVDLLTSSDGSHQMLCAYAIGNHLSNQRTEYMDGLAYGHTEDGFMVSLDVHRDSNGQVFIQGANFIPIWVYLSTANGAEYYVLPLDHPDTLAQTTGLNVTTDANESLARTNAIIGEGVNKIQQALPIK